MLTLKTIQGLWIGPALSTMERLSISSFLANGHPYDLYTYGPVENVPAGVILRDANEILEEDRIFRVQGFLAAFSDFFRWKLLAERGGWWADLDIIALRAFDFHEPYVLAMEQVGKPTSGVAFGPPNSEAFRWMWESCEGRDTSAMRWTEVGPDLVAIAARKFRLQRHLKPPMVFCPIPWQQWKKFVEPRPPALPTRAFAVHLWDNMWARANYDKDAAYPPDSIYERLKLRYLAKDCEACEIQLSA